MQEGGVSVPQQTVVVIGATGNVGRGAALEFSKLPHTTVYIVGRHCSSLERLHKDYLGGAQNVVPICADVTTSAGAFAAHAAIADKTSTIAHLVSCSGPWWNFPPLAELDPENWDEAIQANISAHFYVYRAFIASVTDSFTIVNGAAMSSVPFSGVTGMCAATVHAFALLAESQTKHVCVYEMLISARVSDGEPAPAISSSKIGCFFVAVASGRVRKGSGLVDADADTLCEHT